MLCFVMLIKKLIVDLRKKWKFNLRQPEVYNLGDSLSESSEDCSKELRGKARTYVIFDQGVQF